MRKTSYFIVILSFLLTSGNPIPARAGFTRDIVFPVDGPNYFSDTFAAPRSGGREHEAIDIIADKMTPVVAAVDGRVSLINRPEKSWGYAIYIKDSEGWTYAYLHLNNDTPGTDDGRGGEGYAYAANLQRGDSVSAGDVLGWVGDSGNAENTVPHLHFEIRDQQGTAINPYESLLAARPAGTTNVAPIVTATIIKVPIGGELVKYASNPKVYVLKNGRIYHIYDEYSFTILGFDWNSIRSLPAEETYSEGLPLRFEDGFLAVYEDGTPVTSDTAPPASQNSYVFTETMSLGTRSAEVTELQRVLKSLGYFTYPTLTYYFGPLTESAVISFQKAHSIDPVGIVGPATRAALNAL